MLSTLLQWLPGVIVFSAIFTLPLALRQSARTSYASAAQQVLATFALIIVLSAFGTAIVAPLVLTEQLRMAAIYAAIAASVYLLWCVLIIRPKRRRP